MTRRDADATPSLANVSEAIGALSRLLEAGVDARAEGAVEQILAREARSFFGVAAAVLVTVDPGSRTVEVVGGDPTVRRAEVPLTPDQSAALLEPITTRRAVVREGSARGRTMLGLVGLADLAADRFLLLPMIARDGTQQLLCLVSDGERDFTPADIEVGEAFASAAAASLAQVRLAAENARKVAQNAALARAAKSLNERLELAEMLSRICREAAYILDADVAIAFRGSPEDGVRIEAGFNMPPEAVGYRIAPGVGLAGRVIVDDASVESGDHAGELAPEDWPFMPLGGALGVPMRWGGRLRGVLEVGYRQGKPIPPGGLRLLETFAELASAAYQNASALAGLERTARTDALTGCLNHAALQDALRREIDRCLRGGHGFSLVLLDLDDFKQVNERFGHLVGDEVLRRVGHVLRQAIRSHDLAARYGGDEFALVAIDAAEAEAAEVAKRTVRWLSDTVGEYGDGIAEAARATAGVAEWSPGMSRTELLAAADRALLYGKHGGGRGGVHRASEVPAGGRSPAARFQRPAELAAPDPDVDPAPAAAPGPTAEEVTDRLRRRTRQLALANALGARVSAMTDPAEIMETAADELHRAFGYFASAVIRIRAEDGRVHAAAVRAEEGNVDPIAQWSQPADVGVIGRCLRERRPVIVADTLEDPDFESVPGVPWVRSELVVPLCAGDRLVGAIDIVERRPGAFDDDDARLVATVADQVGSALRSAELYGELDRAYLATAEALATALERRGGREPIRPDGFIETAEAVGRAVGLAGEHLRALRYAAALRDVGTIAVPEEILAKAGPLTADERAVVERHAEIGERMIAPLGFLADVRPLVRHANERWDGAGYPDGLRGERIPLGARVLLACAVWHALTDGRPYRAAVGPAAARDELERVAGSQLDPRVVTALLEVLAVPARGDAPGRAAGAGGTAAAAPTAPASHEDAPPA